MKKALFLSFLLIGSFFAGCGKDSGTNPEEQNSILPPSFKVDIPDAISYDEVLKKVFTDSVNGGAVYANLGLFVHVGESSADLVNDIIAAIKKYNINKPMEVTYTSDDDSRAKKLVVTENAEAAGSVWQYKMTITDGDTALAFQMFWNVSPVKGIAVLYPKNFDRTDNSFVSGMMYKVEYSEADANYDKTMTVSISGLPALGIYGMDNLKMFAGKKGDNIDLYGNSNHPYLILFDRSFTGGRNYAFRARVSATLDIAVAELALPPSSVNTVDGLFTTYSVNIVLKDELYSVMPGLDSALVDLYLADTEAPAFFVKGVGFAGAGAPPANVSGFTESFMNISALYPYVPLDIKNLNVTFF
jgi:hypothetical protein